MSLIRALLLLVDEVSKEAVEKGGVAGKDMTEPPGTHSPWSLPPISGGGLRPPPGSKGPWSWP